MWCIHDMTAAWKKLRFILSDMADSLPIAVHVSTDETLLSR